MKVLLLSSLCCVATSLLNSDSLPFGEVLPLRNQKNMSLVSSETTNQCQRVNVVSNFDIRAYTSKPWYGMKQFPIAYQPANQLYCVRIIYVRRSQNRFNLPPKSSKPQWSQNNIFKRILNAWAATVYRWDYYIANQCNVDSVTGPTRDTIHFLCNRQVRGAKIVVAPCLIPTFFGGGDYWVIYYDENSGGAIVIGGQPDQPTGNGLCEYRKGKKSDVDQGTPGIWILCRKRGGNLCNTSYIQYMEDFLVAAGVDTSRMLPVTHTNCQYQRNYLART